VAALWKNLIFSAILRSRQISGSYPAAPCGCIFAQTSIVPKCLAII
jgi:hypothetical protein